MGESYEGVEMIKQQLLDRFNQQEKVCSVCGSPEVHRHEVYFGRANRKLSVEYGMMEWLCVTHHLHSEFGVHRNREFDLKLKAEYQAIFEEYGTREDFMKIFGRSWL